MNRLAIRLLDHAARIMPPARRDWLCAMRAELAYIERPMAAVAFALGCVRASYAQRLLDIAVIALVARWTLAGYALVCAGCYALAAALMVRIKAEPGLLPSDLGSGPGTAENLRFLQGYPASRLAILPLVALLLMIGAVRLARRQPGAFPTLASAAVGATAVAVLDAGTTWPLAWSVEWFVSLMLIVPVWWLSRRAPDLTPA